MALDRLLLILHSSHIRHVTEAEALLVLSDEDRGKPRSVVTVDTTEFEADVEGGVWDRSNVYLQMEAQRILEIARNEDVSRIFYFGLDEIPHVVALGAHLGDEYHLAVHDPHRDSGKWKWPSSFEEFNVQTANLPEGYTDAGGAAVVRVEISRSISDEDIDAAVPKGRLADVRIRPADRVPDFGIVRSPEQVGAIREAFRASLAAIHETRPEVEIIHLFMAAPVSVAFVIGQELRLRNNPPVQTYRYREATDPHYTDAVFLSPGDARRAAEVLTDEQRAIASRIRAEIWPRALQTLKQYAGSKREDGASMVGAFWFEHLLPREHLEDAQPFPVLPAIWDVVGFDDGVDPEPYEGEYGHDLANDRWRLSDPLLWGLYEAAGMDEETLEELIRLFLFHEYLHHHHSLTKYSAEEVGKFANCLERLDYQADLYALVHQLDFEIRRGRRNLDSDGAKLEFLKAQLDLVIRSFWIFEDDPGELSRWQVRRVRRYLNWYWRLAQLERTDLNTSFVLLSRAPTIEIAGLEHRTGGRRVYVRLDRLDRTTALELGLVMENEKLLRIPNSPTVNLKELLEAIRQRRHQEIKIFFQRVFEAARERNGALPVARRLPPARR